MADRLEIDFDPNQGPSAEALLNMTVRELVRETGRTNADHAEYHVELGGGKLRVVITVDIDFDESRDTQSRDGEESE